MLKIADRELEKLGFKLDAEDECSIIYLKEGEEIDRYVEIFLTGLQTVVSYSMPGNLPTGLTAKEVATFYRKMRELGLRYEG